MFFLGLEERASFGELLRNQIYASLHLKFMYLLFKNSHQKKQIFLVPFRFVKLQLHCIYNTG